MVILVAVFAAELDTLWHAKQSKHRPALLTTASCSLGLATEVYKLVQGEPLQNAHTASDFRK